MDNTKLLQVELNPTDMLVTPLPDYFKIKAKGRFDTDMPENDGFAVGIIEHTGKDLPKKRCGKVIYYHSKISQKINVQGIGTYELVGDDSKLLVRMDQNINNINL